VAGISVGVGEDGSVGGANTVGETIIAVGSVRVAVGARVSAPGRTQAVRRRVNPNSRSKEFFLLIVIEG
jgi:hypothetical protein